MGKDPKEALARAEANFQRKQRAAQDGAEAKAEHEAHGRAVETNTARLRSLRLAKEAADQEAEAKAKRAETSGKTRSPAAKKRRSP